MTLWKLAVTVFSSAMVTPLIRLKALEMAAQWKKNTLGVAHIVGNWKAAVAALEGLWNSPDDSFDWFLAMALALGERQGPQVVRPAVKWMENAGAKNRDLR